MARMRWKKESYGSGIYGRRESSEYHDGTNKFASATQSRNREQWYFVAGWGSGIPHYNSGAVYANEAAAKFAAESYVKTELAKLKAAKRDEPTLLPCPFCGGTKIELTVSPPHIQGTPVRMTCSACEATGPWEYAANASDQKHAAIEAWNRRAPT